MTVATLTLPPMEAPPRYTEVQYREATIEHVDKDAGMILMRAVPYDHEVRLDRELFEQFAPKCFERSTAAPHRCKVWHLHDGPLIGHAREIEDRPDGLWVNAKISNTLAGQEARELAGDGSLDQCSVTFRPSRGFMAVSRKTDGIHVRHARAYLLGVALTPFGAYDEEAYVASVRDADTDKAAEAEQRERDLRKQRVLGWTH